MLPACDEKEMPTILCFSSLDIEATAVFNEGTGYTVNSTRIAVGERLSLKFPEYANVGYCVNVIEY